MEIYISIDGVLRNKIQKFDYHYRDLYLESELEEDEEEEKNPFNYEIVEPILNDSIFDSYKFESVDEFNFFYYVEYPIEIFGHAGLSTPRSITDLNTLINLNSGHTFTVVGLEELGKSKPATLFFLSKNAFLGDNIRFIKNEDIESEWDKCDVWITDNKSIIEKTPEGKESIKFNTDYNKHFSHSCEITNLTEIEKPWIILTDPTTTLTSIDLPKSVESKENLKKEL